MLAVTVVVQMQYPVRPWLCESADRLQRNDEPFPKVYVGIMEEKIEAGREQDGC